MPWAQPPGESCTDWTSSPKKKFSRVVLSAWNAVHEKVVNPKPSGPAHASISTAVTVAGASGAKNSSTGAFGVTRLTRTTLPSAVRAVPTAVTPCGGATVGGTVGAWLVAGTSGAVVPASGGAMTPVVGVVCCSVIGGAVTPGVIAPGSDVVTTGCRSTVVSSFAGGDERDRAGEHERADDGDAEPQATGAAGLLDDRRRRGRADREALR